MGDLEVALGYLDGVQKVEASRDPQMASVFLKAKASATRQDVIEALEDTAFTLISIEQR